MLNLRRHRVLGNVVSWLFAAVVVASPRPSRTLRMQVVSGDLPLAHVRVRLTAPDDTSVIGRVVELVTDDDGVIFLPDFARGAAFSVAVPEISPESRAFSVSNENGSVRWRIAPREWAQQSPNMSLKPELMATTGTTITFTIDCWSNAFQSGNNCDFCSGTITPAPFTYSCSEGSSNWAATCGFTSPVPAGSIVTKVEAVVDMKDCSGQRGYAETIFSTTLNGTEIAPAHTLSLNNCGCVGQTCLLEDFTSADYSTNGGFPGYVDGGTNTFGFLISTGAICVEKVNITLTYANASKHLAITNVTDPIVPANSGLVNDCALRRSTITALATDSGRPQSGVRMTFFSDRNDVTPGTDVFNQPNGTDRNGFATGTIETRKLGIAGITAKATGYPSAPSYPRTFIDAKFENPFKLTAYATSLESDLSGSQTTDPCGVSGTFFDTFLKNVQLEGTGQALDGRLIQYTGKKQGKLCFQEVTCAQTASGACAQAGTTIAVDTDVMPLGSTVNIDQVGVRTAQDTGGAIKNYHIDVYVGAGKAAINAFSLSGTSQAVTLIGGDAQCQ
jgi:3D (Asp-Asp-Asp) domain-containing protein